MGGREDGLACFNLGVRTLIGLSGIVLLLSFLFSPAVIKIPEGVVLGFRVTCKNLPQPLRSHIRSFVTLEQLVKIPTLSGQKCHVQGVGYPIFFGFGILIFFMS
jgi:hypothetical protein